jgi:hypothetical protein
MRPPSAIAVFAVVAAAAVAVRCDATSDGRTTAPLVTALGGDAGLSDDDDRPAAEAPLGTIFAHGARGFARGTLQVAGEYLYWDARGAGDVGAGIKRKSLAGGPVESVLPPAMGAFHLSSFAVLGENVFFADLFHLASVPAEGGASTPHLGVPDGAYYPGIVATGGPDLYWPMQSSTDYHLDILRVPPNTPASCEKRTVSTCAESSCLEPEQRVACRHDSGGDEEVCCSRSPSVEVFAQMPGVTERVVVADGYAYWAVERSYPARIMRKPTSGGEIEELASEPRSSMSRYSSRTLAVGGGRVFWVRNVSIVSVPVTGGIPEEVVTGGVPADVGMADDHSRLETDETHLYFTTRAGIFRVPLSGGTVTPFAKFRGWGAIALSETHLFYVHGDETIRQVAK